MSQGCYRPSYLTKFKAALDNTGALTAFSLQCSGIHGGAIFANRFPAGTVNNYLAQQTAIESNVSTGAWRAPSSNFIAGAEQAFLDEVALVAKQDPIDFRLALLAKGKMSPIGIDNDYDADRYAGVLKLVREKSQWDKPIAGVYRGVSAYYCHNSYVAQVVDVIKVYNGIKISKVWCAVDCGIVVNPEGAINQIEGGIVDGIGHAMYSNITIKDGAAEQENFHHYRMIRHSEAPESIEVFFFEF